MGVTMAAGAEIEAVFQSFDPEIAGWSLALRAPLAVHEAWEARDVLPLLRAAERAAAQGHWVALILTYEAAPAFDPAHAVHAGSALPLAWAAVFDRCHPLPAWPAADRAPLATWTARVPPQDYAAALQRIRAHIEAGDTYQVNYTFPMEAEFAGDDRAWFARLCQAQRAAYCAYVNLGRFRVLCASPELFVERDGERLTTRPMKGTLRRGRWCDEDVVRARELATSTKNRAENVMIVDLLRNDLGRVAVPGSVHVHRLFAVERLEHVLQMTSTVQATCRPGTNWCDLMSALFPCGSVTGAPKVQTMRIIREVEPFPRQVYTGSIGFLAPGGAGTFNVAIRTVLLDTQTGRAVFNVGGGITYDSTPAGEYDECLDKARFLHDAQTGFRLLESLLLERGEFFLLERHLARLRESAGYFRFPFAEAAVRERLEAVRQQAAGRCKVRLLLSLDGALTVEAQELAAPTGAVLRLAVDTEPVDSSNPFQCHKTTRREVYDRARRSRPDADDVLLWNERGELTESCVANLVVKQGGTLWTPPRECGLLPGTFRQELLERGEIRERILRREDLAGAEAVYLINSVRQWIPVRVVS
jgi:para-aminobenzoate synthetase/4-amino-4-deoxychorismate lyase